MSKLRSKLPFFLSKAVAPTPEEQEPIWVEYLESSSTQYIDTGFKPNQDTSASITFQQVINTTGSAFWGTRDSAIPTNSFLFWGAKAGYWRDQYDSQNFVSTILHDNNKHTVVKDKNKTYLDGTLFKEYTYTAFNCSHNLLLFCANENGVPYYYANARIYSCQLYDNGVLIRDFRPCLHPVTNEPAMYDMVEKKYYYNQGTGTFKHGDILSQDPIWLEYLESDGKQYIDLDYVMTDMVGVRSEVVEQATFTSGFNSVFGFLGNLGSTATQPRYGYSYYSGGFLFTFNQTPAQFDTTNMEHHLAVMYSNENYEQFGFVNGVAQKMNGTTFTDEFVADNTLSMYLFARNVNGTAGNNYFGKIYSFRHYDHTGALVMDLRPCLHPTTRRPAMYDVVRKRYFYNQGTGEFIYDEMLMVLDYIESDGNQYIDTGYLADAKTTEFDFEFMQLNGTYSYAGLIGSRQVAPRVTHPYNVFLANNGYQVRYDWGWTTNQVQLALEPNQKHKLSVKLDSISTWAYVYMDDVQVKETVVASATRTTMPMFVGNFNNGGAPYLTYGGAPMRIYSLRITDSKILMRDYIPVRTRAGKIGLWDFATGKLYENAGTGVFKAYIGDIQFGSIQSDGTQYIDTGIVMKTMKNCYVELASQSTYVDTVFRTQLGFMKSASEIMPRFGIADYSGSRMFSFNSTSATSDKVNTDTVVYKIKSDDERIAAYVNGIERLKPLFVDTGFAENELTLWLFARNVAGALNTPWSGKLYYFEYQDANTKHKMVPAKLADGRIGLWDFESKRLYENDGTGEFVFE